MRRLTETPCDGAIRQALKNQAELSVVSFIIPAISLVTTNRLRGVGGGGGGCGGVTQMDNQ